MSAEPARPPASAGLCGACGHASVITSAKQSTFVLCGLSRTEPSFPKYPRLPVLRCDGYRPAPGAVEDQGHQR